MKKRTKIIMIVIIVLGIFFTFGSIDYSRVKKGNPPILSIYIGKNKNSSVERWIGFGYTISKCPSTTTSGNYTVSILSMRYVCVTAFEVEIGGYGDYKIVDETESCDTALEEIYRDNRYIYYLDCIKSESIFLEYENGVKITLKEALNRRVSIYDLINRGLEVYQKRITNN